jgi:hypothetical protein
VEEYERATAETLEQNEKRVFKLYYPSESNLTPLQQEAFRSAYRHSIFRCMDLPESTLDRIMARAQRTGDRALEQAYYHECVDRGLFGLANEYRERHPEAKQAWETYEQARRHAESNDALLGRALLSNATP